MKKFFKRTIACLIAMLMVISSLPFTAFAEDSSVQPVVDDGVGVTCSMRNYGVFTDKNGGSDRFKANNWIDITNDGTSDTFTIGYINFDISGIKASEFDEIHGDFTLRHQKYQYEYTSLQVMYPTQNQGLFDNQTSNTQGDKLNDTAFNSIWTDGGYAQNAKNYFGLEKIGTFTYDAYMSSSKDDTIDVGPAIQQALKAGLDYATVVFLLANEDSNGKFVDGKSGSYWTDTYVYFDDLTVKRVFNFKATESTTVQKPASFDVNTANTAPKTGTSNYSIGGVTMPADYSNNVLYCSSGSEVIKTDPNKNWLYRLSVAPYNTVLMYDGQTNPAMPIMFGLAAGGNSDIRVLGAYLDTTWAGSNFEAKTEFKGYKQAKIDGNNIDSQKTGTVSNFKFTSGTSFDNVDKELKLINYEFSGHDGNNKDAGDGTDFNTKTHPTANGAYYWWNKMDYVGSVNTDTYFQKFTNPVIKSCSNNNNWGWTGRHVDVKPNNSNIYVLNYKPIYDVLKNTETVSALGGNYTFKDLYNNVWGHESDFDSPAAVNRYYSAVEKLISIDPQAELANCADDQVESKVKELGVKIKTAYSRYVSAAKDLRYKVDWNAYHDATGLVSVALNQDSSTYTDASIKAFEDTVNPVIASANKAQNNPATKQADIDNYTSQLLSALSMLRKKSITIKIKICKNENTINRPDETVDYGTALPIDSGIDPTKESVKGWVVRTKTADGKETATKVGTIDSTFTLHATKDATVEAYVVPRTDETTTAYSRVIFYGFNGRVIDVKYLQNGTTLEEKDYTSAPTVPFYSFTNWSAESVTGNGKDIIVRANYSADASAQKCNVHYDGFENGSKQYSYDQYVYLPDVQNGEYFALSTSAEATEKTILTYLNGREFHAPMVKDIYVVKVSAADRKAKVAITGSYPTKVDDKGEIASEADYTKKRAVFNCKFYLPDNCEAVEWGAKISANNHTMPVKSDKNSKYNEYSIYMNVPKNSSIKGFTAVAYVTYRDKSTGEYTTMESQPVTQGLN